MPVSMFCTPARISLELFFKYIPKKQTIWTPVTYAQNAGLPTLLIPAALQRPVTCHLMRDFTDVLKRVFALKYHYSGAKLVLNLSNIHLWEYIYRLLLMILF